MANFLDNFFEMFKFGDKKGKKRNNTASNNNLANMKDKHVSFGEDPGSLEGLEDGEK